MYWSTDLPSEYEGMEGRGILFNYFYFDYEKEERVALQLLTGNNWFTDELLLSICFVLMGAV